MITGPKHSDSYPDRDIDCQAAIAGKLVEAIDEAEAVGWDRMEAARAVVQVAIKLQMGEAGLDSEE